VNILDTLTDRLRTYIHAWETLHRDYFHQKSVYRALHVSPVIYDEIRTISPVYHYQAYPIIENLRLLPDYNINGLEVQLREEDNLLAILNLDSVGPIYYDFSLFRMHENHVMGIASNYGHTSVYKQPIYPSNPLPKLPPLTTTTVTNTSYIPPMGMSFTQLSFDDKDIFKLQKPAPKPVSKPKLNRICRKTDWD